MAARIMTVVGARPQFIKAAMMSLAFASSGEFDEEIVHTGQHYDANMSQIFFEELGIPAPAQNLGISGGTHADMTGRMLIALENAMMERSPDMVLVYGDTNSTLAASLSAAKLHIPVCHAEAGARTRALTNPEEVNRICTDHVASIDCAPTPGCYDNLVSEGLESKSSFTGDLMYDSYAFWGARLDGAGIALKSLDGEPLRLPGRYAYLTCHREENTSREKLREVIGAASRIGLSAVYPVHPRMRERAGRIVEDLHASNVLLVEPVGYFESLALLSGCEYVVTDSGGLQREAFFAGKSCITLLPFPSCDELLADGSNVLVPDLTASSILAAIDAANPVDPSFQPFGDGRAAEKIMMLMADYLRRRDR